MKTLQSAYRPEICNDDRAMTLFGKYLALDAFRDMELTHPIEVAHEASKVLRVREEFLEAAKPYLIEPDAN